jgi:hypothetical protein
MRMISFGALLGLAGLTGAVLQAQTVTLAPTGYISAGPGGTVQLTAKVSGYTGDMKLVWTAGGKVGGNPSVGTVTQDGLYTAPATISTPGMTPVVATLGGNTKYSATAYIYLLKAGPAITSVTPSPLPSGTQNVTITGSGFEAGAVVSENGVALTNKSLSSTSITTTVYNSRGTLVPTTSVDQYAATMAEWFGVSSDDALTIFPYVKNFLPKTNLGFLG